MKKILPLVFMFAGLVSSAQIVNIPDTNFRAALMAPYCEDMGFGSSVDLNGDGQIQYSEAATITELTIRPCGPISDLTGIEAFVNLKKLTYLNKSTFPILNLTGLGSLEELHVGPMIYGPGSITNLDVSNLTNLKRTIISTSLTSINVDGCTSLKRLECNGSAITSLSIPGNISLDTLECNGCSALTTLDLHGCSNLVWLRFESTPALTTLNLNGCSSLPGLYVLPGILSSLDMGGCTSAEYVVFSNNQVSNLNMANTPSLTGVFCNGNQLSSLDLSGRVNLTQLDIRSNSLTSLNVSGCSSLLELKCSNMQINNLQVNGCSSLGWLECQGNQLSSLDLSGANALTFLDCRHNQLSGTLDLSNRPDIYMVFSSYNQFDSISVQNCPKLVQLDFEYNQVHGINTNGCDTLEMVTAYMNQLTSVDFSNVPRLRYFVGSGNPGLTYVNVKNGWTTNTYINVLEDPNMQYICADDDEVLTILNFLAGFGITNVNVNSYCSFVPGGQFNTIHGTVKLDLDNNGCDINDNTVNELRVKVEQGTDSAYTTVDVTGNYTLYTYAGNFTVTPQFQHPYFSVSPATVSFPASNGSVQDIDFCITKNGVHPDLDITLIALERARPGFNSAYKLVYKNKGTETLAGNVSLNFDNGKMSFLIAGPAPTTQTGGLITWAYSNLKPFETRTINIQFNVLAPPVNNINDTLTLTTDITPLAGDETALDNAFALQQVVTGSFDPNDKASLEGAIFDVTRVGDYAHYVIRFQNMGTAEAENIVVKDMLDNNFDWNSVELIQSSHPCILKQTAGNRLEFIFEGINLPPVTTDEPGSHGYVAFKVKTKPTLVLGDSLKNTAAIYFDYNLPVITNVAGSVVGETGTIPISMEYFRGSRQSNKHYLTWKASCTSIQAKFDIERSNDGRNYQSIGNIIASNTRCLQPFDFMDANPLNGINYYRIRMTDVDGKSNYSSVVVLLNKKSGLEIISLTPNPVAGGKGTLNISSAEKKPVHITVTDAAGKTVQVIDQDLIAGFTQISMDFKKLAAAVYSITIQTGAEEKKTIRFIKQ